MIREEKCFLSSGGRFKCPLIKQSMQNNQIFQCLLYVVGPGSRQAGIGGPVQKPVLSATRKHLQDFLLARLKAKFLFRTRNIQVKDGKFQVCYSSS